MFSDTEGLTAVETESIVNKLEKYKVGFFFKASEVISGYGNSSIH